MNDLAIFCRIRGTNLYQVDARSGDPWQIRSHTALTLIWRNVVPNLFYAIEFVYMCCVYELVVGSMANWKRVIFRRFANKRHWQWSIRTHTHTDVTIRYGRNESTLSVRLWKIMKHISVSPSDQIRDNSFPMRRSIYDGRNSKVPRVAATSRPYTLVNNKHRELFSPFHKNWSSRREIRSDEFFGVRKVPRVTRVLKGRSRWKRKRVVERKRREKGERERKGRKKKKERDWECATFLSWRGTTFRFVF